MPTLILLAHVPTDAVNEGFLPAARRLGLSVTLLTDQAEAHRRYFSVEGRRRTRTSSDASEIAAESIGPCGSF